MKRSYWHRNRPQYPDRTRPAEILTRRITHYADGTPQYEAQARCDDGKTRTFVSGPEGRWVRSGR